MALILSIETSTTVCSVALTRGKDVIATQKLFLEKSHSNLLTVIIQDLIKACGFGLIDFNAIAISEGPGSYTGLRIGVSTAKGLAYSLEKPLIAVSTLKAMAHEVSQYYTEDCLLVPMLDARRMEVYTATFGVDLESIDEVRALILDEESFRETLASKKVLFHGDGAAKFKPLVQAIDNAKFIENVSPSAWAIGQLAFEKYQKEQFEDVAYFEPFYLKEFKATTPKALL
ncbi:tRNA (adenosine(37)-N6)-threonylcarbamoyltransferase complex dimerization subunit type 1 TsaB [Roseivirga sp. E12]|uniref:tRNA (adenosine(37)-N6)-threonylcarbamoyltransferase complex dimerization subunit type 1 TsaB n=1 Tax=Roseivirga sp. E12 TaxID=2819237 RepID=UPI001ABCC9E4|nr:tRNA (adenosine(37)-N6)-threonylcarbamoyltransferase complex dimerization subunit type 1 TsaB [Roseivirga sp. E12]MBO3700876.1 tRNA (adenosine(37)-N6)-threonylcarbamoyltransferase complex dimerization subunit type 1 TsaB [Roseivirga sp. E12]